MSFPKRYASITYKYYVMLLCSIILYMDFPESGRSPGEGHGNPLQYSCLENPMDRGAWWAIVLLYVMPQSFIYVCTYKHYIIYISFIFICIYIITLVLCFIVYRRENDKAKFEQ